MMSAFLILGQTNGFVLDSEDNPIEKVSVYLVDQKIILYTNENGIFLIDKEIPDNSSMYFYKLGYSSKLVKYQKDIQFKVILERLHVTLDEIGVTESFNELGNSRLTNIEKKSLEDISLNSNSMVDGITNLSGVDMISSGLGIQKIVVRGLSGMRVITYLNGMKINNQQWANDHGIGFTELGLGELELIKGASALKYGGEAIGGLLYFKDQPFISSKKIKGFLSTKFNNSSYLSSSQFGIKWNMRDFYFNLYGQYSLSSDYRLPNNDYLFNSRFKQNAIKFSIAHRYKNLQNIFRYQLHTEETGIPAHVCVGDPALQDILELTSSSLDFSEDYKTNRPSQFINNQLFVYESSYLINDLKLSLHAGHFINNLMEYELWTRPEFGLTITHTQLSPNIRYSMKDLVFNIGSSVSILENENGEADDKLVPNASTFNIGSYLIVDYEKNNFGFNSGVRHDNKRLESSDKMLDEDYDNLFSNTSFSFGLYYNLSDHIIRGTYSGAFRAPDFAELFSNGVHHGTNRYEIGDSKLNIEYSDQFDLKYQWSNDHFGFVLNPFVQYISDFISVNPTGLTNGGYKEYRYIQYDNVELKGIEMNLHYHPHQLHNLHLEQSYSFLQVNNKDSEYGLALVPANSIKTIALFDFNSLSTKNLRLDYFSINHTYKFKQESFAEYEELTEDYNVINLQLALKLSSRLRSTLSVNNLFNEEYSPHISRIRGVAGGIPNPGRFFNISLKYEF